MTRRELLAAWAAPSPAWDTQGQVQRRREIYALYLRHARPEAARELRVCLWGAMATGDYPTLPDTLGSDAFVDLALAELLVRDRGELPAELRAKIRALLAGMLRRDAGRDIRFLGHNANFPAMATAACVLASQVLEDAAALRRAREALSRLTELFERRGLLSEFTSPTYSPITLLSFAEIVEHSRDPEIRALAAAMEEHLWLDLATHYHAPTNVLAGPHSRAYTVDSDGHPHHVQMTLYHVFGERLWMTPARYLFPPVPGQVVHHADPHFMQASNVWMASATYHPSQRVAELLFDKPVPFQVSATAELGATRDRVDFFEYPAAEVVTTTYLAEDFCVGSATAQYADGNQTDAFHVCFRRREAARSLEDIATVYCRYLANEVSPGAADMVADKGRVRAVQKRGTVLALYQAKNRLTGGLTSLRLCIIIPAFYGGPRRILVGGREVDPAAGFASPGPEIVWIEDHLLFAAFRPLALTDHGRRAAMRVAVENGYVVISFVNYEGTARTFTRKQLAATCNGFVAELGAGREYTFAAFQERVLAGRVEDDVMSGERHAAYRRPGVRLAIGHSLTADGLKYALVDGKLLERPRMSMGRIAE